MFYVMLSPVSFFIFFFFNDTATTEIYTLSLHDALPISVRKFIVRRARAARDQRLLLGEFREIDPARCAFDRVSLLMSALRTVHDPALIPPPRRAGLGPGPSFAPASAAGAHCGALYNEGIARKDPMSSPAERPIG